MKKQLSLLMSYLNLDKIKNFVYNIIRKEIKGELIWQKLVMQI